MNLPPPRHAFSRVRRPAAFSLIELLAAMAVLAIIVLIVGRLFAASSNMWSVGNQRIQQSTNARAALDFMAKEIGAAMSDSVVGMRVDNGIKPDLISGQSDILTVATLTQKPEASEKREARQITYFLSRDDVKTNRFNLARGALLNTPAMKAYSQRIPDHREVAQDLLIVNVAAFQARVYTWDGARLKYEKNFTSDSTTNPPVAIELVLGLMSDEEARRQDSLGKITNDVRRASVRWYSTMVHLRQAQSHSY